MEGRAKGGAGFTFQGRVEVDFILFYFFAVIWRVIRCFFFFVILEKKSEIEWQGQKDEQPIKTISFLLSTSANLVIDSVSVSTLSLYLLLAYHPVKSDSSSNSGSGGGGLYQAVA